MLFYSTTGESKNVSLKEAVLQGIAPDGGLYLPDSLPHFSLEQIKRLRGLSFLELSIELSQIIFNNILNPSDVIKVCEEAFNFPATLLPFPNKLYLFELFHGPSLSFKDFGARFLASLMHLWRKDEEYIILTATSGDTGSAVGQAFYNLPGMHVYILFPKGHVTPFQKQQLTTIGYNVKAIEVDGSFEECQNILREALVDPELRQEALVTTANSMNIARIFAQALYYFYAYAQLPEQTNPAIFSVPCGNFGHLVSGILAKKMGLPIQKFLGVTNINDEIPLYLHTGIFRPHEAYPTLAVSMDVGNPSNFPRLIELYGRSLEKLQQDLIGVSVSDEQIAESIKQMYTTYGYLLDPHSATAYLALREYLILEKQEFPGIFFATAHPSKFQENLKTLVPTEIPTPERLINIFHKPQRFISIPPHYRALRELFFVKT